MRINVNKDKITGLLKDFHEVTGLRIALFGLDKKEIAAYPENFSKLCYLVKLNKKTSENCKQCDIKAFTECERKKNLYIYKCHLGLTEAVLPIFHEETIIAFLMFGQVFDGDNKKVLIEKAFKKLQIKDKSFKKAAYSSLTEMSHKKIEAIARMMEVYASYIQFSDCIYVFMGGIAPLIKTFIEHNIDKELSIDVITKRFNIGKTTACNKFKEAFHITINQFIIKKRLEKAKEILRNGNHTVSEVSDLCGFSDYNYFIRTFRKHIGKTPSVFAST